LVLFFLECLRPPLPPPIRRRFPESLSSVRVPLGRSFFDGASYASPSFPSRCPSLLLPGETETSRSCARTFPRASFSESHLFLLLTASHFFPPKSGRSKPFFWLAGATARTIWLFSFSSAFRASILPKRDAICLFAAQLLGELGRDPLRCCVPPTGRISFEDHSFFRSSPPPCWPLRSPSRQNTVLIPFPKSTRPTESYSPPPQISSLTPRFVVLWQFTDGLHP